MLEALDDEAEGVLGLAAEERAQAAAEDDDEFRRLEEHGPVAMGHGIANAHRGCDNNEANEQIHAVPPVRPRRGVRGIPCPGGNVRAMWPEYILLRCPSQRRNAVNL